MTTDTVTQRWVLGLSAVASFLVVLDQLVVATALSTIQRDLGASLEDLEWTVTAYVLSFAVLLMTGAVLGDRLGQRRVFAGGLGLFSLASAACALAPTTGALIAARAVQGAGAAAIMALGLALLNAAFPPERRGWATGVYGAVTGLAATVGPVAGGAVVQGIAWQWVFWLSVPVGLVAMPLVLAKVPESAGQRVPLDLPGLVLAAVAAFGLVGALLRAGSVGWASPRTLLPLAAGLLAAAGFVAVERRAAAPMLPPRLFGSAAFSAGNAVMFLVNAVLTGAIFLAAQFFQVAAGQGPLQAGLRLLLWGLAPMLLVSRAGALADRHGERPLAIAGALTMATGLGWTALVAGPATPYAALAVPIALSGGGLALVVPAATRAVVSRVERPDMGRAAGAFGTFRQLGGAFGVAVLGAVFAATGGYGDPGSFTAGYGPAMGVAAGLALGAAVAATALPAAQRVPVRVPAPAPS